MRVRDIMTQPAQTCHLDADLVFASRRMREAGCDALRSIGAPQAAAHRAAARG